MADFDSLLKDYKNFLTPAMKIKIDGNDIQSTYKVGVTNATVKLSTEDAGSVDFSIVNIYDLKGSKISTDISSNITLGKVISVEMGYGSKLKEVFKGFISSITYDFGGVPSMSVTAHDARRLMMKNVRRGLDFTEKKYSEVAKKVMNTYKSLCPKSEVTDTTAEVPIQQNGDDYNFLKNDIGRKGNREFFIINDTYYFRDFSKEKEVLLTLERGKGLISFNSGVKYLNEEIIVYGHDKQKNEVLSAKKAVKTDSDTPAVASPGLVREIQKTEAVSKELVDLMLGKETDEALQGARTGSGSCIGLPDIIPGKYLKIDKLDTSVNKTYYLKEVTHTFGADGYTTDFVVGGTL